MGIQASLNDLLLFTDPIFSPLSYQLVKQMARFLTPA